MFFGVPFTVFGDDSLQYLNTIKGKRAFIVTDATIAKLGLAELVVNELKPANIECKIFDGSSLTRPLRQWKKLRP